MTRGQHPRARSAGRNLTSRRPRPRRPKSQTATIDQPLWPLTDGEIHFLYWFSQGSIMIPETRWRLRDSWGLCERHAWGALAVEMAFRHRFLLGQTILYADLMERCVDAFDLQGPWQAHRLAKRLAGDGRCMMCDMNVHGAGRGYARVSLIKRGRRTDDLRIFALESRDHWSETVCGICGRDAGAARCRRHLLEELAGGNRMAIERHRAFLKRVLDHLLAYERSFVWGHRDTDTPKDRASLFSAIGWFSGWQPLLALIDRTGSSPSHRIREL